MQVQLDLDIFSSGNELVVPLQYYSAKYFDDKGLAKQRFAVGVDSRDELRKGALIETTDKRVAVICQRLLLREIKGEYHGKLIYADSLCTTIEEYLQNVLFTSAIQIDQLETNYTIQKKES